MRNHTGQIKHHSLPLEVENAVLIATSANDYTPRQYFLVVQLKSGQLAYLLRKIGEYILFRLENSCQKPASKTSITIDP